MSQQSATSTEIARNAADASMLAAETESMSVEIPDEVDRLSEAVNELEKSTTGFKM